MTKDRMHADDDWLLTPEPTSSDPRGFEGADDVLEVDDDFLLVPLEEDDKDPDENEDE